MTGDPPPARPIQRHIRIDPDRLYQALDRHRRSLRVSGAEMLRQAGIAGTRSTWTRLALDRCVPSADNLARLLVWLGDTDLRPYLTEDTNA